MSIAVIATTFALVAVAELPDKTMIATLVMGSRSRPLLVWIGASGAFLVHVTLAVAAGRLLELLPHRVLEVIITVLFMAGAVYLLVVPEQSEEAKGAAEGGDTLEGTGGNRSALAPGAGKVVATAFGVILVGEFGDLTQLLTINLVARYHQPFSVFTGASAALVAVAAVGAFGGRALLRFVPLAVIRRVGGVVLAGFAAYGIYSLVR
ncbi:MAG: TMEM165/GDT1 family protein [Acidimicrobiales bacterium]